ncbi:aldehyde dehydrogenase family protein, partial [Escherichia coli]|nr:aldehyde dehydrogenase family protein [Escherichia coli]
MQDVLYGPMISERFARRFEEHLDLVEPHHAVRGEVGRITRTHPRPGFVGDPDTRLFYPPTVVAGVRPEDAIANTETFGPIVGVARFETWE